MTVLCPRGEIDLATAPCLHTALREANGPVVLDLSSVTFIDAAGVRVIERHLPKQIAIVSPVPHVRRVLEICGFSDHLV